MFFFVPSFGDNMFISELVECCKELEEMTGMNSSNRNWSSLLIFYITAKWYSKMEVRACMVLTVHGGRWCRWFIVCACHDDHASPEELVWHANEDHINSGGGM